MRLISLLILSSVFVGCASFSMGNGRAPACEPPVIPTKPDVSILLARTGSTGIFADQIVDLENYVCISPDDSKAKEVWIRDVLRACGK